MRARILALLPATLALALFAGCSDSRRRSTAPPPAGPSAPTVTLVTPSSGTTLGNTAVTLSGT